MALSHFAGGALVAAPIAGVLTWLAVTWQQHVDVRVERDTAVVRADRAEFNQDFKREWSAMTGDPIPACDTDTFRELARLRKRTLDLEAKLAGSSESLERDAAELRDLMVEERR